MLIGKGQFLKLQIVLYAQEQVDIDAKGVGGQFSEEPGTQAPESREVLNFN